jgi:hypothetical protein
MNLVGVWVVDETDAQALERWGNVVLEFDESGGLTYTIRGDDKNEIIILRYRVEGSTIITDQPSAPRVERTQFSFTPDGVLILALGGVPSRFVRVSLRSTHPTCYILFIRGRRKWQLMLPHATLFVSRL